MKAKKHVFFLGVKKIFLEKKKKKKFFDKKKKISFF
jgi:hypothetical protein